MLAKQDEGFITVKNLTGKPAALIREMDRGGMAVLRFGRDFIFLLYGQAGGYFLLSHGAPAQSFCKEFLGESRRNAGKVKCLIHGAEQLFHVSGDSAQDIYSVMLGLERDILKFFPAAPENNTYNCEAFHLEEEWF